MCLDITKNMTRKISRAFDNSKKITFYKVLFINRYGEAFGIYHINYNWKAGWNKSDRKSADLTGTEKLYGVVNHGLHVFLTKKQAIRMENPSKNSFRVVVPVTGYKKDFVAGGTYAEVGSAVFTKVWLSRKDLDKARAIIKTRVKGR